MKKMYKFNNYEINLFYPIECLIEIFNDINTEYENYVKIKYE